MSNRDYVRMQIDTLPDSVIDKVHEYIAFQLFTLGAYQDETEYLESVPGMVDKIKDGMNTPLSDCVPLSEVWGDV